MRAGAAAGQDTMRRPARIFGLAGLLGASLFAASLVVLHWARGDIDWARHYVSDFANGRLGWVFVAGTVVHGVGNLALSLGLRRSLNPGPLRDRAVLLLGLAAAGIVVAAFFPIDAAGRPPTLVGLVHRTVATAAFALELVALYAFSAAFAPHPRWRPRRGIAFVLATVAAVGLAGFLLAFASDRLPGLAERLALASFLAWEFWVACELARGLRADEHTAATPPIHSL